MRRPQPLRSAVAALAAAALSVAPAVAETPTAAPAQAPLTIRVGQAEDFSRIEFRWAARRADGRASRRPGADGQLQPRRQARPRRSEVGAAEVGQVGRRAPREGRPGLRPHADRRRRRHDRRRPTAPTSSTSSPSRPPPPAPAQAPPPTRPDPVPFGGTVAMRPAPGRPAAAARLPLAQSARRGGLPPRRRDLDRVRRRGQASTLASAPKNVVQYRRDPELPGPGLFGGADHHPRAGRLRGRADGSDWARDPGAVQRAAVHRGEARPRRLPPARRR